MNSQAVIPCKSFGTRGTLETANGYYRFRFNTEILITVSFDVFHVFRVIRFCFSEVFNLEIFIFSFEFFYDWFNHWFRVFNFFGFTCMNICKMFFEILSEPKFVSTQSTFISVKHEKLILNGGKHEEML